MNKDLFDSYVIILLSAFLNRTETSEKFEKTIHKCLKGEGRTEKESNAIVRHFKKEVFPLDKKIILWMRINLRKGEINFVSKHKEMKKLFKHLQQN